MPSPDILAIGEPLFELNQAKGEDVFRQGHGGDTSNCVIAAARQGVTVGYITAIGAEQFGESFMKLWAAEGVDTSAVKRSQSAHTGLYFITHGPDGHVFSYMRAGSAASRMTPEDMPAEMIKGARILHASGISLAISSSAADAVFSAIRIARAAGVTVSFDTNLRLRLWPLDRARAVIHAAATLSDILRPGLDDAIHLTGLADPDRIVDFYLSLGPKIVALTLGSDGALVATKERRERLPPVPVRCRRRDRRRRHVRWRVSRGIPADRRSVRRRALRQCRGGALDRGLWGGRPDAAARRGRGGAQIAGDERRRATLSEAPIGLSALLAEAAARGARYIENLDRRPVFPDEAARAGLAELKAPLADDPADPEEILARLDRVGSPATVASTGGRYFGFVTGGTLPAALAANMLAAAWDQNAAFEVMSPAAAAIETAAAAMVLDVLGLPADAAVGFGSGATMANFTGLAAARHALLARAGWDVEDDGLFGAPPIEVVVGGEVHASLLKALASPRPRALTPASRARRWRGAIAGGHASRALGDDHSLSPGRQREQRRARSLRRGRAAGEGGGRLGARRRRLRPLDARIAETPPSRRRRRGSRTPGRSTATNG